MAHQLGLLALPPQSDPTEKALEVALFKLHNEVWLHTQSHPSHGDNLSLMQLQKAMTAAQQAVSELEWQEQGPAFAALRAGKAVGWDLTTAMHITTHTQWNQ